MLDQAQRLRQLAQRWHQRRSRRTIAITSGKGGVGKSNVAVNLGLALSKNNYTVTLLDADLGLANVDVLLGISPPHNLGQVVQRKCSVTDTVYPTHGINVIAGGSGLQELVALPESELLHLFYNASQLDSDFFLIDTGAGISSRVTSIALAAQEVILVTTPEPTSLTDTYALTKVLLQNNTDLTLHLILNRTASEAEAVQISTNFSRVVQEFLSVSVNYLGYIPEDPSLRKAVLRQQPLLEIFPAAPAAKQLGRIAADLSGDARPARDGSGWGGFINRLRALFH